MFDFNVISESNSNVRFIDNETLRINYSYLPKQNNGYYQYSIGSIKFLEEFAYEGKDITINLKHSGNKSFRKYIYQGYFLANFRIWTIQ